MSTKGRTHLIMIFVHLKEAFKKFNPAYELQDLAGVLSIMYWNIDYNGIDYITSNFG